MSDRPGTVLDSLNQALHGLMEHDARVHVLGEDVLDPYGGAFKVTKGLSTRFRDRVWTTPISESAIVGLGVGMALRGLRPVVEIMFGDFLTLAADQLVNHAAKFRWMFNDAVRVPLVVRAPMGGRRGYGPTHSQTLEKHFLGVPGLWVVAPSIFGNPGLLLEQATLSCDDAVLFIESKTCYARPLAACPAGMREECFDTPDAPFATLRFSWARGSDGVLCCYGAMAPIAAEAVRTLSEDEGVAVDLVVFAQLSPTPASHLDWLLEREPTVLMVAEEASVMAGWSAELVAAIEEQRAARGSPAVRYGRIGARHEPVASSAWLERQMLPQVADLVAAVLEQF